MQPSASNKWKYHIWYIIYDNSSVFFIAWLKNCGCIRCASSAMCSFLLRREVLTLLLCVEIFILLQSDAEHKEKISKILSGTHPNHLQKTQSMNLYIYIRFKPVKERKRGGTGNPALLSYGEWMKEGVFKPECTIYKCGVPLKKKNGNLSSTGGGEAQLSQV